MANLTIEQNQNLSEYERMFFSEGWKLLAEDLKERQSELGDKALRATNDKELFFLKGLNEVYTYILGLPDLIREVRKSYEEV